METDVQLGAYTVPVILTVILALVYKFGGTSVADQVEGHHCLPGGHRPGLCGPLVHRQAVDAGQRSGLCHLRFDDRGERGGIV